MELGHIFEERVGIGLEDVEESDAREVALNGAVPKVLFLEECGKAAEGLF